jgi:hypothetical protein
MLSRSRKNRRVETVGALIEEDTKEAKEEDMDEGRGRGYVVVEEDHLPILTMVK